VRAAAQRTGASLTEIFPGQLAIEINRDARFSPDGRLLAAIDSGYLIVVNVDTEARQQLTATNWDQAPYGFAGAPVWSPDGKRIAYGWFIDGHYELRVMPAEGGQPQVLFNKGSFYPNDWSPDGTQILGWLVREDGKTSLATVSSSGGMAELRTWDRALPTAAAFSPDGRHVAYGASVDGRSQVFLLSRAAKSETALTKPPHTDRLPVWSPGGAALLFVSDRSGRSDLWELPMRDGMPAGEPRIAYADIGDVRTMCGWDGKGRLVFTRQVTFGQLHSVNIDVVGAATLGPPERPVAQFEGKHAQAVWSPDGKHLALLAQTRERGAIYVVSSDTGETRELNTRDLGWTRIAGWLPGGDGLAISAMPGQGTRGIYLFRLAGGAPEMLYADADMSWASAQLSPDGTAVVAAFGDAVRVVDLERRQTIREMTLQPGEGYNGFAWAPDGKAVYALVGQRAMKMPLPSGEPQTIAAGAFRSLAVSPDGRTLALTGIAVSGKESRPDAEYRYELYVASTAGGDLKRVALPDDHRPWRVRWAGAGKIGYVSNIARSQFLRLSDFLSRE
jgi:Tol biopolymer transport system component